VPVDEEMNMRNSRRWLLGFLGVVIVGGFLAHAQRQTPAGARGRAQTPSTDGAARGGRGAPGQQVYTLEDAYLDWPLAAADRQYAAIDGKHLHGYVKEITAISRSYRDQGHQYWGRIEGTTADKENADWVAAKFKAAGLDVRMQEFDLPLQWMPQSWEVSAQAGSKSITLDTAQPGSRQASTPAGGLDVDIVYVGLGTEADFSGRDVRGKAVVIYSIPMPGVWSNSASTNGAVARAQGKGAIAALVVIALPGNIRHQFSVGGRGAPPAGGAPVAAAQTAAAAPAAGFQGFTLGYQDGESLRTLIEQAPAGQPAHVKIRIETRMVPNLKSYNVWGTLPGTTDEKIMVIAHRDGYFEAAGDNASGMATMIGLAEYYAKVPKAQRRRTLEFVGTTGHHGTPIGVSWMADNREAALAKTALVINAEHTALTAQHFFAGNLRPSNTMNALHWSFNGSRKLIDIAVKAFSAFGVPTYDGTDGVAMAEISRISRLVPSFGVIDVDTYYHSDHETDATVPWTGLAATTRAFAKIMDEVNKVEIKDLQPSSN
jgi:hypothetical protein